MNAPEEQHASPPRRLPTLVLPIDHAKPDPHKRSLLKGPRFTLLRRSAPCLVQPVQILHAATSAPDHSTWLYELKSAQPLPVIDLTKTPAAMILSGTMHTRAVKFMRAKYGYLIIMYRAVATTYYAMVFVPSPTLRNTLSLLLLGILLPLCLMSGFLSLELLSLLSRNYEFWFISTVNVAQWTCLAIIFGDLRSVTCFATWVAVQTVICLDANYRTFPGATKSIVMSIPVLLVISVSYTLSAIPDTQYLTVPLGSSSISSTDVLLFTSITLALFMAKKVFVKYRRRRRSPWGQHEIPCVVLRARLRLERVNASWCERRHATTPLVPGDHSGDLELVANDLHSQKLRLCKRPTSLIDAQRTVLPVLGRWISSSSEPSWGVRIVALYVVGAAGILATVGAWTMILLFPAQHEAVTQTLCVAAGAFSLVFTGVFLAACQRDLLRSLLLSFDWVFSAVQMDALAVCLCDLLQWQVLHCGSVLACWLWFHWVLLLDALTPPVKARLCFRKKFAVPVMCSLLLGGIGLIFVFIFGGQDSPLQRNRVFWHIWVSSTHSYELQTMSFAAMRVVTIVGWNARLILELARQDDAGLVFLRGLLEYSSPFETFPAEAAPSNERGVAVQPAEDPAHG